ncbi:hypothetical protein [Streptomyces sp. MST-110588]|uniref:hypothetical protein n=1 Tax=Streptomyces sp. MST-110588 TaxID=2833628 RepID=UPI001F5D58FB|nr:hypothetical protein [Streptomyces sp. MST-110588]UNO41785.1 hypothetical protein KGS77_22360 [Streptomyces sp. MST-110588]
MHSHVDHLDLGAAHVTRRDPARAVQHMTREANALGPTVCCDLITSTTSATVTS